MITKKGRRANSGNNKTRMDSVESAKIVVIHGRKRIVVKEVFNEFCDSSTIHGLKYLGTRPTHEKIWWILVFSVSICLCGFQIQTVWNKWDQNPVIVSFNENFITISEIPFPAVTICHQIKSRKKDFEYGELYEKFLEFGLTDKEYSSFEKKIKIFELISQTCIKDGNQDDMRKIVSAFANKSNTMDLNDIYLEELAPSLKETLVFCSGVLMPKPWDCIKGFATILTDDGVCYTFNLLNGTELLREGVIFNYEESFPPSALNWSFDISQIDPRKPSFEFNNPFYPMRVFTPGQRLIVRLASNTNDDYDNQCPGLGHRFRIYLHSPEEVPWSNHQYQDIDIKTVGTLFVTPRIVMATSRMRTSYTPEKRKCFFEDEKYLKYFKRYTKRNCELECLTNITLSVCGCVRFSFPRVENTRICGLKDYICATRTAWFYFNVETAAASLNFTRHFQGKFKCNCWSACSSVEYGAELRTAKLFDNELKTLTQVNDDRDVLNETGGNTITYEMAKLYVSFKETEFFAMKRSELYGLTDFIANCGGLLGLFMGVSILSFVEIIYFFTVRFFSGLLYRHKTVDECVNDDE